MTDGIDTEAFIKGLLEQGTGMTCDPLKGKPQP
jgi:hypothetical protein